MYRKSAVARIISACAALLLAESAQGQGLVVRPTQNLTFGLLLPGDRKSMQPISSRVAPKDVEQVHHFVATSCWDTAPVEEVLCQKVD